MAKLSVIIPSRDERFLTPTIDDIFRNARGEVEVVAVLDSDTWPGDWKEVTARHPHLHTIHNGSPKGMRHSINAGVASAVSRGATYVAKFDGHVALGEGFDEILKAECEPDWIVVPRRLRLEPESWTIAEPDKPPHDYHYLSFPDNPDDFGGAGLNGRPWVERTKERLNKPEYLLDEEMSSQGSGWFMHAAYFSRLELMDEASYGPFWNEFQELGLKCWLSGGRVIVNKRTHYAHLHKGKKYGRGYRLDEKWLTMGRNHTMLWPWNEAWDKQTKPFEWLIDHFWPVPTWPENWREVLYAKRKPRAVGVNAAVVDNGGNVGTIDSDSGNTAEKVNGGLVILQAHYGVDSLEDVDVRAHLQSLVKDNSLDIIVNNSTLTPGQNPFRGKRKQLNVTYSIDGGDVVTRTVEEKDWLIIGLVAEREPLLKCAVRDRLTPSLMAPTSEVGAGVCSDQCADKWREDHVNPVERGLKPQVIDFKGVPLVVVGQAEPLSIQNPPAMTFSGPDGLSLPTTAPALNDYLIRRFSISPQRLRGPMPIELRDFHRNDLAQLFAELGFKRGAEIGVAEGRYSEIICKANPEVELYCVDPWSSYPTNPQAKSSERHEYAYNETKRKLEGYNAHLIRKSSIDAVKEFDKDYLDFVYVDGNHLYDFVSLDLILWSNKVRCGGIVSGDDYYALDQKRWVGGGVVEAVQAYTNAHRIGVWWIFQGHKSVDFMWVKP